MQSHANKNDIILEANGESYTYANRISTFTGLATVLGWKVHEWLWRSANSSTNFPTSVNERMYDVMILYNSDDYELTKKTLLKYDISYIVVGYMERIWFSNDELVIKNENNLKKFGDIVFTSNIDYPTYIIKVNKELLTS